MERTISCIVIDDESPAVRLMEEFIKQTDGLKLSGSFKSPVAAIQFLQSNKVDLAFCDIQMPEMTGINMVRVLEQAPEIVFTTAYSEFAAEAFEVNAVDYLRKPFSYDRFLRAVGKAKDQLYVKQVWKKEGMQVEQTDRRFLVIRSDHKTIKVMFDEIVYIEAFQEYVKIFTETERHITLERMKNLEAMLPSDEFIRVHRSYIVAKSRVRSLSGNLLQLSETQIPVSREMKDRVTKMLF